MKIKQKD